MTKYAYAYVMNHKLELIESICYGTLGYSLYIAVPWVKTQILWNSLKTPVQ